MPYLSARGLRFFYQRLGQGSHTVVFLHGLIMDNLSSWYFTLANRVAEQSDVILYDMRGHGRSDRPAEGYKVQDAVSDLRAILDGLSVSYPVHLVGNSFGGLVALSFAATYPQDVASMALVDAHAATSLWQDAMRQDFALGVEERYKKVGAAFQHWLNRHSSRKVTNLARAAHALGLETTLRQDIESSQIMTDEDFARVTCPVLGLYGEHTDIRETAELLASKVPHFTLEYMAGCTHSILWEALPQVRDRICGWLDGHRDLG